MRVPSVLERWAGDRPFHATTEVHRLLLVGPVAGVQGGAPERSLGLSVPVEDPPCVGQRLQLGSDLMKCVTAHGHPPHPCAFFIDGHRSYDSSPEFPLKQYCFWIFTILEESGHSVGLYCALPTVV